MPSSAPATTSSVLTSDILQRFFKIASLIQPQPLYYIPPHRPLSQHLLFICAHTLTSAKFRLFATLSHQTLQCPPWRYIDTSKFDDFGSMTSLVLIPTGAASTAFPQFHGHFISYFHFLPPANFSIYFTLKTQLSYKPFNNSIQTILHTFIPPTLLTISLSKMLMPPLSLGPKISHPFSWM